MFLLVYARSDCVLLFLLYGCGVSREEQQIIAKEWCFPARLSSGEQTAPLR